MSKTKDAEFFPDTLRVFLKIFFKRYLEILFEGNFFFIKKLIEFGQKIFWIESRLSKLDVASEDIISLWKEYNFRVIVNCYILYMEQLFWLIELCIFKFCVRVCVFVFSLVCVCVRTWVFWWIYKLIKNISIWDKK